MNLIKKILLKKNIELLFKLAHSKKGKLLGKSPNIFQRAYINFKHGFSEIKHNFRVWNSVIFGDPHPMYAALFWAYMVSWEIDRGQNTFLPMEEYHWINQFLIHQGYSKDSIVIGGFAPFTIEAEHPKGHNLYFRSRGSSSLEVYTGDYEDTWDDKSSILFDIDVDGEYLGGTEAFQHFYHHYSDLKDMLED